MVSNELKISFYHQGQLFCELDVPDASFQLLDCDGPLRLGGYVGKNMEADFNTGEIYGLRKYNVALSADEAEDVAVCVDDPAIDDVDYTDTIGNPCAYYASFLAENGYTLCTAATEQSCPIACGVKRMCPNRVKADAMFSRTLQFLPPVMCLTDTGLDVLTSNLASREESNPRRRLGHIPKVTEYNAASFVESGRCSGGSLDNYDLNDFSVVVWTKGKPHQLEFLTDFTTLAEHESDPALNFAKGAFAAQTNVLWATNRAPGAKTYAELRPGTGSRVTEDEWIMHALTWNGSHVCYFINGENACEAIANYSNSRILGVYVSALDGNSAYLHSMRMSTVRTFSPALKEPHMVRMYYNELRHYSDHISGPKMTDLQESIRAPIQMLNYAPKTINFMPPLTFQRRYPSSTLQPCQGFAAETAAILQSVRDSKCRGYDCSRITSEVLECLDESKAGESTNETYFGRSPSIFNSDQVYSEFLHTFKSELLYRDGEGRLNLDTYLNSRTRDQKILALMFTPSLNTATVLTVTFDFTYAEPKASYKIEHFFGLTGEALTIVIAADIVLGSLSLLLLVFSVRPFVVAARRVLDLHNEHMSKRRKLRRVMQVVPTALRLLVEVGLCVGLIVFACLHAANAMRSDSELIDYFKPALQIPWSDPEIAYDTKVGNCFSAVSNIQGLLQRERMLRLFAFVLMLCCVVRLIGYMTVHPRINLLVATMVEAGDEVLHFLVSFAVIFFMLALIALAFFGMSQPDFATFNSAALNLLLMVFGEIPNNLAMQPTNFIIFFIIVYCVTSLFMLNFFLAIVIDAYGAVKQSVTNQITEQSIFKDTLEVFLLGLSRKLRGWPSHHAIIDKLHKLPPGETVTFRQLESVLGDGETATNFVMYYRTYDLMAMDAENEAAPVAPIAPEEESDKEGKREHDEIAPTPELAEVMALNVQVKPLHV